jgi:hypothetical protein
MTPLPPATLIARAMRLEVELPDPVDLPPGSVCALTGEQIRRGYPRRLLTTTATAEFLDHFRGRLHGHVSQDAAHCYRSSQPSMGNPVGRAFFVSESRGAFPVIARASAAPDCGEQWRHIPWGQLPRPCWSDLVREIWPGLRGESVSILLTTDQKKRLWPRLLPGRLGARTPVYCYDTKLALERLLWLDWEALLACLDLLERIYTLGAAKIHLLHGLHGCTSLPLRQRCELEQELARWRSRPEFLPALLIAQKQDASASG